MLTVGQPADGVYMYQRLQRENRERAAQALKFLEWNGGGLYGSGIGIGTIDSQGDVHPDQFWQTYTIGNVRKEPFSRIWSSSKDPILAGLRNRAGKVTGRCSTCRYFNLCGGGFRVRAAQTGDPWASDPACYLSDTEIARP
jgi:radical SAM protein with 4Fe4S-binding SPASM domain